VHLIGGIEEAGGDGYTTVIRTAPINSDGTIGTWSTGLPLPFNARLSSGLVVIGNKVYLLSSIMNGGEGFETNINEDGSLGTWTINNKGIPYIDNNTNNSLYHTKAVVVKNRVYVFGGWSGGFYPSGATGDNHNRYIYTAAIDSNGNIGTWETLPNLFPDEKLAGPEALVT
jgi:hypothetical protein